MHNGSLSDKILAYLARVHARRVLARFMHAAEEATAVQQRVLLDKVRANAQSDYGRDHRFDSISSYTDFVRQVPVSTYNDLAPYVERVRNGETSAMFGPGQRVHMFAMTSGTSDEPKYIPVTNRFLVDYRRGWNAFGVKALMDHPDAFMLPIVQVSSPMDEARAPSGLPCGAITGLMATTQKRIVRRFYVTPPCVGYIHDSGVRYYTIARLALAGDVGFMITANPATLLRIARSADTNAEQLFRDVADGTLRPPGGTIPKRVERELVPRLRADPVRAKFLEDVAAKTGRLLPKDVWRLGFIATWTGGTMGLYLRDFPEYFGDVPIRDIGLLASEGRMSIPVEDHTPSGILDVTANFFEFIPADEIESSQPTVLRSHEVQVGAEYFILLTTSAGFYRYNIGDQVRVTGFCGQAPMIEFLHKGLHVASLAGEKLTEQQVVLAFERACRDVDINATTFVLAAQWGECPFYRLHIEEGAARAQALQRRLGEAMDRQLRSANIEYASKQDTARLGPVEVNRVPDGFFARLEAKATADRRGRHEQYKHRYLYPMPGQDADFPSAAVGVGSANR